MLVSGIVVTSSIISVSVTQPIPIAHFWPYGQSALLEQEGFGGSSSTYLHTLLTQLAF